MVLWPRARGARPRARAGWWWSTPPSERSQAVLPDGRGAGGPGAAGRHRRGGRGGDGDARRSGGSDPAAPCGAERRRAAGERGGDRASCVDAHRTAAPRRRWRRRCSMTRRATGAWCATPSGAVLRVVETKDHGRLDARPSARSGRSTPGIFVFAARALSDGAAASERRRTRRGSCTCRRCSTCCEPTGRRSPRTVIDDERAGAERQRPRRRSRGCARLAQAAIHERHMRAGVRIVDPRRR